MKVLGVSKDPVAKQKKFADKYEFTYALLSDESGGMVEAYQAWGEKKFMGKVYDGIHRIAYLVGADGAIEKVYGKVATKSFATDVLADL